MVRFDQFTEIGPLYESTVRAMSQYRSLVARMANANWTTQGKLDARLIELSERISELLAQLTDAERSALDCWREGILPNTYCVDHEAIKQKPYISIRRVVRTTVEHSDDADEPSTSEPEDTAVRQRMLNLLKRANR